MRENRFFMPRLSKGREFAFLRGRNLTNCQMKSVFCLSDEKVLYVQRL